MKAPLFAPGIVTEGGGGGTGGINYRGEWTSAPPTSYQVNDLVVISIGANMGSYLCVTAGTTNNPGTGIGWVTLSRTNAAGQWG